MAEKTELYFIVEVSNLKFLLHGFIVRNAQVCNIQIHTFPWDVAKFVLVVLVFVMFDSLI